MSNGSFFSKLAKIGRPEEDEEFDEEVESVDLLVDSEEDEDFPSEGELSVDVYKDGNQIVIKAMTPGVKKDDLEIQLSRDSLTLRGFRNEDIDIDEDDYHYRELYWGSFSRTIHLPEEVDIDQAEAHEEHGLLTVRLPILDKKRQSKLKVKESK